MPRDAESRDRDDRPPARIGWLETETARNITFHFFLPFVAHFIALMCAGVLMFFLIRGYVQWSVAEGLNKMHQSVSEKK